MKKLLVTLIVLVASCQVFASQPTQWKQVKNKHGIEVYNRRIEGSEFKEFRSETKVNANLSTIIALFTDTSVGTQWVENIDRMEELAHFDDAHTITKTFTKAPWPVANREAIVENYITQDKDSLVVTIQQKGRPDYIANKNKGVIRIPYLSSQWVLTPIDSETTHISYQVLTDPGGKIPAWLINMVSVSQPYKTLLGLTEMAKKSSYREQRISYIINFNGKQKSD